MQKPISLLALVVVLILFTNCKKDDDPIETDNDVKYWFEASSPVTDDLFGIFFINENIGWAVGSNSSIIKTTDGGATWKKQTYNSFANFDDVFFINENTGWIIGTYGTVVQTTNGGTTWTLLTNGSIKGSFALALHDVYFSNDKNGWVVGDEGTGSGGAILQTTDGGKTWVAKASQLPTHLNALQVINEKQIFAGGGFSSPAMLYYTTDAGENWTEIKIGTEQFTISDIAYNNSTLYLVCPFYEDGYISSDLGDTWYKNSSFSYSNKVMIDDEVTWSSGSDQKFSTDGGITWTKTTEKNSNDINDGEWMNCFFAIGNKAWAATSEGKIFYYQ